MERQLLTVEETADVLNIGRTRVYELLATGELASIRIGRLRRIPRRLHPRLHRQAIGESTVTEPKRTRVANGRSSVYLGSDGVWHGRVSMGVKDDGTPDRRHVRGATRTEASDKVKELERQRDSGTAKRAGATKWTVQSWLEHWLDEIVAPTVRRTTLTGYRTAVNKHLVPGIGAHRLAKLTPEHVEKLYGRMSRSGLKAGTVHQAHRTLRAALNEAVRREHITKNPAVLAKAPKLDDEEVEPFTVEEARRLLAAASERRNGLRWVVALSLGLRKGEALGLRWDDVDLDAGTLRIRRQLQRPTFTHGCGGTCGRKPGRCRQRVQHDDHVVDTKSKAGRRGIGLPAPVVDMLRHHKASQEAERERAAEWWHEGGWVFTQPHGRPLNLRTDHNHWKALLADAGVRDARLHDARHTAATMLLLLGVPDRAVMATMGWSHASMAARYQHVTGTIRQDIADRVGGLLWATD